MNVTIATFAHNEENNIARHLQCWLNQILPQDIKISEIVVVADGCTDQTVPIVREIQKSRPQVRLIEVQERRGITPLINIILHEVKSDVLLLEPADTLPSSHHVRHLAGHFKDQKVGVVVGKAEPNNDPKDVFGYAARLLYEWNYLSEIVQVDFEGGTAIRNGIIGSVAETVVDNEAYIHRTVTDAGYQVIYEPLAKVVNRGPDNIRDFLAQRRRNLFMHLQVRKTGARSPHSEVLTVLPLFFMEARANPRRIPYLAIILFLSGISYAAAVCDLVAKKSHMKWQMITSTKSIDISWKQRSTHGQRTDLDVLQE